MNGGTSCVFLLGLLILWSPTLTLRPRSQALSLAERTAVSMRHRLRLEDDTGYWTFEDGSTIIYGDPCLSLLSRIHDLTLSVRTFKR